MEILDRTGQAVVPGDRIAAAFRVGNVAELRTGTIDSFGERGNNLTIVVNWEANNAFAPKKSAIEAHLRRFVKIGA